VQLDAAGAFTYTVGASAEATNGLVEVSLDDPAFSAPRIASLSSDLGSASWRLPLGAADLTTGTHTVYVRQRINGRDPSPVASRAFTVADTVEQSVTAMVSMSTANARSSLGVSSYDLTLKNISTQSIFSPIRLELASISSASGNVRVANADNALTGVGAIWDYSTKLGADNTLTANEVSGARNLKFTNPNNEPFTVTFNVIGNLPRGNSSSMTAGSSTESFSSSGGKSSGTFQSVTGGVMTSLYKLVYNPLLNTVTIELIKP
jgi:hypothetical protein